MIPIPRKILTNDRTSWPAMGLDLCRADPGRVANAVKYAINMGYRYFDCAWIHGNEAEIGSAIRERIDAEEVEREELFISTKLWNNFHERRKVVEQLRSTLSTMGLEYVNLYIMHWPLAFRENARIVPFGEGLRAYSNIDYLETWKGMEDCLLAGFTKKIGVANFNSDQIDRLMTFPQLRIRPVVNQIEVHPFLDQSRLILDCRAHGIKVIGYCPLGLNNNELCTTNSFPERSISDPGIKAIAKRYKKSPAQVVFNYLVYQLNIIVVHKTLHEFRIWEYADSFNFMLNAQDVNYLMSLRISNRRLCSFSAFSDHQHYPFRAPIL